MQLDLLAQVQAALRARYAVEAEIGRGGMAMVCRARDLRHDRPVAIKVLYPDLARAVGGERFLREIAILAKLSHPNILPLLDSGSIEIVPGLGVPWYAMPLVTEDSLRGRLVREGSLPLDQALRITAEVAGALAHAHAEGFVHRDIKPENILLRSGHAVVADFGIARAVTVAGGGTLSSTGIVVGTPAYMSPEQSAGSEKVDARSDLYSLGIVLYEMLAGHPPFTGNTPQAIGARHQFEPPPPIRVVRPTVPEGVERLLERMLEKVPADRVGSAGELVEVLPRVQAEVRAATTGSRKERRRWWLAPAAVAGAMATLMVGAIAVRAATLVPVDPEKVVVLPFQHVGDAAPALIRGVDCATLIDDALGRWPDLPKVDGLRVQSAIVAAGLPHTLGDGERIARSLGAGQLIWGQVFQAGDSVRVRAMLYRLGWFGSRTVAEAAIGLPIGASGQADPALAREVVGKFIMLARQLMARGEGRAEDLDESLETTSFAALRAKLAGDGALGAWDLELARQRYRDAVAIDPGYPQANLSLAQLRSWSNEPAEDWRPDAMKALTAPNRLSPRQNVLARALVAMADGQHPEACGAYRRLLARDSSDFLAWFGLGECLAKDRGVVASAGSPSGLAFRTSYTEAMRAYSRALELVPLSHAAFTGTALQGLLDRYFVEPNRFRLGAVAGADTTWVAAFPQAEADTLAFTPRPIGEVMAGQWRINNTRPAASLGQRALLETTRRWITALPASQSAWRTHAVALELNGLLGPSTSPAAGALPALRHARALPGGAHEALELAVDEVRALVKLGRFADAGALADSLLGQVLPAETEEYRWLAGLAAMTGRVARAAELARRSGEGDEFVTVQGGYLDVPDPVSADALALLTYASLGAPADSVRAVAQRLSTAADVQPTPEGRAQYRFALLARPTLLAYPLLGAPMGDGPLEGVMHALSRNDTVEARKAWGTLAALRGGDRPGDRGAEGALLDARLLLLLGDEEEARRQVEGMLEHLSTLGRHVFDDIPQAAALGRVLDLAVMLRVGSPGRDWAREQRALWRNADPVLRRVKR